MNLIRAEFLKLIYPRRTWAILLASVALSVLAAGFSAYALVQLDGVVSMPLSTVDAVDGIYAKSLSGYLFALIIGVLIVTSEFHQHTAIATFLASPRRHRPLIAKVVVAAIGGAVVSLVSTLAGMYAASISLSFYPEAVAPSHDIWLTYSAVSLLTGSTVAVIGVGIGALVRNQTAALVGSLVWFFVVDRVLAVLFVDIGKYLVTGLITSLMSLQLDVSGAGLEINTADYLPVWPAAGLLVAYAVAFIVVSLVTTMRRDVD